MNFTCLWTWKRWLKKLNVNSTPAAESTCPSLRGRWALAPQNPEHVYYLCSLSGSAKILCLLCLFILYCNWGERKWRRKDYIWSDTKVLFQWGIRTVMFFYMELCVCVCVRLCLCVDQLCSSVATIFRFKVKPSILFDDCPTVSL